MYGMQWIWPLWHLICSISSAAFSLCSNCSVSIKALLFSSDFLEAQLFNRSKSSFACSKIWCKPSVLRRKVWTRLSNSTWNSLRNLWLLVWWFLCRWFSTPDLKSRTALVRRSCCSDFCTYPSSFCFASIFSFNLFKTTNESSHEYQAAISYITQ